MINLAVQGAMALASAYNERKQRKREEAKNAYDSTFETDRDARIKQAQGRIDSVFDSPKRTGQVQQYGQSVRQLLAQNLGRQQKDVARNTKFGLARQGLIGSSVQNDANNRLAREYGEATIANEREAQKSIADLRAQDEQARLALKQMATQGLSATQANRRALQSATGNLNAAASDSSVGAIGDYLTGATGAYKASEERAAQRRGYGYTGRRADLWGRGL